MFLPHALCIDDFSKGRFRVGGYLCLVGLLA